MGLLTNRTAVGALILCGAFVFGAVAIGMYFYERHFINAAIIVQGQVTAENVHHDKDNDFYHPVFQFQDLQGRSHTVESNVGSGSPSHQVGDVVTVLYNPANAQDAQLNDFWSQWLIPVVFGIIAATACLAGLAILLLPRLWTRKTKTPPKLPGQSA